MLSISSRGCLRRTLRKGSQPVRPWPIPTSMALIQRDYRSSCRRRRIVPSFYELIFQELLFIYAFMLSWSVIKINLIYFVYVRASVFCFIISEIYSIFLFATAAIGSLLSPSCIDRRLGSDRHWARWWARLFSGVLRFLSIRVWRWDCSNCGNDCLSARFLKALWKDSTAWGLLFEEGNLSLCRAGASGHCGIPIG